MSINHLRELWKKGDSNASFSGETNFSRHTGVSRNILKQNVFPHLITYQKFRVAKRPHVYNPYFVYTHRTIIQSDLIFMDQPKSMIKDNAGFKYVLIVQDIFSRKIWARALKTKQAKEVKEHLHDIFTEMEPFNDNARFVIDRGTEYLNNTVKELLRQFNIKITHPSDGHASHVERANLSLQRILFQKMTEQGSRKWIGFLSKAVEIMNNRHHRIIKMSPNEADEIQSRDKVNEAMAIYRQKAFNAEKKKTKKKRFNVNDLVRIQRAKTIFNRGYQPTFSNEVFKISEVIDNLPITMYRITEWDGTAIEGNFYPEELTLVKGDIFKVEKIIKRGRHNGIRSAYVKWEGFADKYNSWIPLSDIIEQ